MIPQSELDRRVQHAVERILDDESLTSDLEDIQAKVLIDWGVAEVERQARLTVNIQDETQASDVLDQIVSRTRQTMKRVAKTADKQGIASPAELTQMLAQTLQAVEQQVPAPPTPTPEVVLPSAVDLVAPPPPAPARPEPVELPSAVDLVDQEPRRQVGLLTRFLRFLGFKGG